MLKTQIMKFQEESIPYLYFLLENNRFNQIIKGMINQTVSKKLLTQCGYTYEKYSGLENFKLNTSVARFSIRQLVYLKGSSFQRVKQYQNKPLLDLIYKKLKTQLPTSECRKTLWVQFSQLYQNPHFYNNLKQFQLPTQFETMIKKDIHRTYKIPQVKVKTSQVLGIFAIYNPFIGYCQGMNSIIAFLIDDGFTCEEAFFIFKYITENLLPCDYYNTMDCIMAYMRIFYQLLSFTHPQIYAKLKFIAKQMDNSYMAMVSFVLQWFVCLFCTDNVNIQITRVIWDFFLIQGVITLFKAGIAMFDLLQHHILKCNTFQQYNEMQKTHIKQITNSKHIRQKIISFYISPTILFLLKQKLTNQKQKIINIDKKKSLKFHKIKCNKKWNSCAQVINNNFDNNVVYDYFVFKGKSEINIMDNYLEKMDKIYFNNQKVGNMIDELKIGRIQHICHPQQDVLTQDSISERSGETSLQIRKKYAQSLSDPKSPIKMSQSTLRRKAARKIQEAMKKKPGMQRSQSLIFMQKMAQNVSLSNLLQLYQVDEMFQQ